MFNFFKSNNKITNTEKVSITYFIKDDNVPMIDISLSDYDSTTITLLCTLLDILSNDAAYINTIQMIQENLTVNNQNEALLKILTHISKQKNNKITSYLTEKRESETCIIPSEVIM